jgi:hypothetical protein
MQQIGSKYVLKYDFGRDGSGGATSESDVTPNRGGLIPFERIAFRSDSTSSTTSTNTSTRPMQTSPGLTGDGFDHGVPTDGRGACYTVLVTTPPSAAPIALSPAPMHTRTVVVQVWAHERCGTIKGYKAPLRPILFGDPPQKFMLSAPIPGYAFSTVGNPETVHIQAPDGYRWIDEHWRLDHGTLRVKRHAGQPAVHERDSLSCREGDIVNLGRSLFSGNGMALFPLSVSHPPLVTTTNTHGDGTAPCS